MIDASAIAEIIATYQKHGWILRRVLLSEALVRKLGKDKEKLFSKATISLSGIDAAWFSRPPKTGAVAWELRYLGEPPFALLENVDEKDAEFDKILQETESRLYKSVTPKQTA